MKKLLAITPIVIVVMGIYLFFFWIAPLISGFGIEGIIYIHLSIGVTIGFAYWFALGMEYLSNGR